MTFAVFDFPAIAKLTKAFADTPPQNEVKTTSIMSMSSDESHVYGYDADHQPFPPDYSCWAAVSRPANLTGLPLLTAGTLMGGPRPTKLGG